MNQSTDDPRVADGKGYTWAAIATIARNTVAEALHSRVATAALLVVAAGIGLGQFAATLALTDSRGIGAAAQGWVYRLAGAFLIASFAISSLVRENNDKALELVFSLPLPRSGYLAGKWAGCAIAATALAVLFALPLMLVAPPSAVVAWGLSLFLELSLVAAAALLCAITFNHVVGSLASVIAFYTLSRVMGAVLAIGASPVAPTDSAALKASNAVLHFIATLLPRLDRFCRTEWLTGPVNPWPEMPLIAAQAVVYAALLLAAAYIDLMRKSV